MKTRVGFVAFCLLLPLFVSAQTKAVRPKISGLAFVRVGVGDMETATAFYGGKLGLPAVTSPCFGQDTKCFFVAIGQQVDLVKMEKAPKNDRIDAIGFYTADASALRKYLLSYGQKPQEIVAGSPGGSSFLIRDPEDHLIEFIQLGKGIAGSVSGRTIDSAHLIHAGWVVKDRAAMDAFYKDVLGFHLYWQGGMKDGETSWVSMQVPDGTDWIEYMLNIPADADKHLLGVMNHIAIGVPSVAAVAKELEANGMKLTEQPKIGRDGKWQLNLYDPDLTRVEFMEFTPVEKPCCSEFTGTHPKP